MITREQALDLLRSDDLIGIGMEADAVRRKWHPEGIVTYIIDRNINYTNFCTEYCSFCAFYRPLGHAEGYILPKEVIFQKIQETIDLGGTGVLMQGGLHPDLKIEWYEDLFRSIKQRFAIHLHCLSAPEVTNIAEVSGMSLRDTIAQRLNHLEIVRNLQEETGGFTAFIPWPFQREHTSLGRFVKEEATAVEYLKMLAVSRIYLDNIEHIQSSWVTPGLKTCQLGLRFGGNDVGSIMIEENVVSAAGTHHRASEEELRRLIRDAGFVPKQRDTLYRTYFLN